MAHHGPNPYPFSEGPKSTRDKDFAVNKLKRALHDQTGLIGATDAYPQGHLNKDDDGEIRFRVGAENGKVILDFGTPVVWTGMDAQQAADLASSLMKWARIAAREKGEMVSFNLSAP